MKIPAQEKIAELEARIAKLEKDAEEHWGRVYQYRSVSTSRKGVFGEHWNKMWEHFDKLMESAFR